MSTVLSFSIKDVNNMLDHTMTEWNMCFVRYTQNISLLSGITHHHLLGQKSLNRRFLHTKWWPQPPNVLEPPLSNPVDFMPWEETTNAASDLLQNSQEIKAHNSKLLAQTSLFFHIFQTASGVVLLHNIARSNTAKCAWELLAGFK